MEALEAVMKKRIDSSSSSSSHENALFSSSFSFNVTSASSYDEWLCYPSRCSRTSMERFQGTLGDNTQGVS
jgi:hypothetical protein